MAMLSLQALPVEMIMEIFKHLEVTDQRTLRLVNRFLGSIANCYALKSLTFCMCKRDFDMLREIMNQPHLLRHIQSLVYVVETLSLKRQTFEMYALAVQRDDDLSESVGKWFGDESSRNPTTPLSPLQLRQNFDCYTQFFNEQEDILVNKRDHQIIKDLVAKLPNLREINVSSGNEIASVKKSPFKACRKVCEVPFVDGRISTRHLHSMLRAIEASRVRLQTFRAFTVHFDMFDEISFSLHKLTDLLGNITCFQLGIEAFEDMHLPIGTDDPHEIFVELLECNKTMKSGTVQRVLSSMPNLVSLKLSFVEYHGEPQGTFPPPAFLQHILPRHAKWPNLKTLLLSNLMTDRQPLAKFLSRHRESLKDVALDQIRLATTSWRKLLPMLRKLYAGSGVNIDITDFISSLSESDDGPTMPEIWQLGHPEWDEIDNHLGLPANREINELALAVRTYLTTTGKMECPLREDNMHFWETEEEDEEDEFFEDDDDVFWEAELE